jgi:hypothetical protein
MKRFILAFGLIFATLGLVEFLHPNFDYHKREVVAKLAR